MKLAYKRQTLGKLKTLQLFTASVHKSIAFTVRQGYRSFFCVVQAQTLLGLPWSLSFPTLLSKSYPLLANQPSCFYLDNLYLVSNKTTFRQRYFYFQYFRYLFGKILQHCFRAVRFRHDKWIAQIKSISYKKRNTVGYLAMKQNIPLHKFSQLNIRLPLSLSLRNRRRILTNHRLLRFFLSLRIWGRTFVPVLPNLKALRIKNQSVTKTVRRNFIAVYCHRYMTRYAPRYVRRKWRHLQHKVFTAIEKHVSDKHFNRNERRIFMYLDGKYQSKTRYYAKKQHLRKYLRIKQLPNTVSGLSAAVIVPTHHVFYTRRVQRSVDRRQLLRWLMPRSRKRRLLQSPFTFSTLKNKLLPHYYTWRRLNDLYTTSLASQELYFNLETRRLLGHHYRRAKLSTKYTTKHWRFVRKYRAFIRVTALRNNIFLLAQQGNSIIAAHTGLFEELKHGTKRKRTQLTGWYMTDRFSTAVNEIIKKKTTFFVDFFGKSGARSGVLKSWRASNNWRLVQLSSRTPLAYNGTKPRRRRRL